jgi:hypothetical protein
MTLTCKAKVITRKISEFENEKLMCESRLIIFFVFDLRNSRLSHTLVLSGHMVRKVDAGSSLGDDMFRKGDGRYLSGYKDGKGRDEKLLALTVLVCIGEVQWLFGEDS